jgi:undecaprenyl-diphosphatase
VTARSSRLPSAVLLVTGSAFIVLAVAVLLIGTKPADVAIREVILGATSPSLIAVMRIVNVAGDWRFLLPATLLLFAIFDRARRTWWVWVTLMIAAPLAEGALKLVVGRPRPEGAAYGFPSGHATAAAAYAGALLYLSEALAPRPRRAVRLLAVMMIVLVGIARVMLRAHWPSDVIGGFALGLALASVAALIAAEKAG